MTSAHEWNVFLREKASELLSQQISDDPCAAEDLPVQDHGDRDGDPPTVHPDHPLGKEILRLYCEIKNVEDSDGGWTGADVVDLLAAFFLRVGIDIDAGADVVEQALRAAPQVFTVVGLRDNDSGEFLPAGVLPGSVPCLESDDDSGGLQRVAYSVQAGDPDQAEELAAVEAAADD